MRKVISEQKSTPVSQYSTTTTHYNNQNGSNLSELDTLLQDLSAARYGSNLEKYGKVGKSSLGSQNALNDSAKRPSVDDLLEELNNAQGAGAGAVYAVPTRWVLFLFETLLKFNKYFVIAVCDRSLIHCLIFVLDWDRASHPAENT